MMSSTLTFEDFDADDDEDLGDSHSLLLPLLLSSLNQPVPRFTKNLKIMLSSSQGRLQFISNMS